MSKHHALKMKGGINGFFFNEGKVKLDASTTLGSTTTINNSIYLIRKTKGKYRK